MPHSQGNNVTRYGAFALALGLDISLGYESLRGKAPPPRDVPYTCRLLRPGKSFCFFYS